MYITSDPEGSENWIGWAIDMKKYRPYNDVTLMINNEDYDIQDFYSEEAGQGIDITNADGKYVGELLGVSLAPTDDEIQFKVNEEAVIRFILSIVGTN